MRIRIGGRSTIYSQRNGIYIADLRSRTVRSLACGRRNELAVQRHGAAARRSAQRQIGAESHGGRAAGNWFSVSEERRKLSDGDVTSVKASVRDPPV